MQSNPVVEPALSVQERFKFTATGGEYFRIWIVNLLLSIVTLGIYSAWAKVRRNQYFYSSTELAGSSFEYHGKPVAILKGRIAAVALIAGYNIAFSISPIAGVIALLLMAAVMPLMVWKSLQFKLQNASYRGIRFGFDGDVRKAYLYYLLLPVLSGLTAGLLTPFAYQRSKRFQHSESRYGASHFSFDGKVSSFYKIYGMVFAATLLIGGAFGVAFFALGVNVFARQSGASVVGMFALIILFYLAIALLLPLFMCMLQNLIWNHTALDQHRMRSELKWGPMAFILVTNLLGILFTCGLFTPFARVRMMRYRLESTSLQVHGSLDDYVADNRAQTSALGEGAADIFDFDLSF